MTYILEVPVADGGRLLVEAPADGIPRDLDLAAVRPGEVMAHARESLESSLDQLKPALEVLGTRLRSLKPDAVTVEFGMTLSAEAGIVVAKGRSDVHFAVTLSWHGESGSAEG